MRGDRLAGGDVPAEGQRGGDHGFHLIEIGQHFLRCSSSSMYSARSLRRVIGVRRSCPMAVSRKVRSSTKRRMRAAMVLKATAAMTISLGPVSGNGGRVHHVAAQAFGGFGQCAHRHHQLPHRPDDHDGAQQRS